MFNKLKLKPSSPLFLFVLFLISFFLLIGVVPSIVYHSIFIDSAQNMAWANTFSWGYSSHPPLGAWILILFRFIFRNVEVAVFFASALCLMLSLIYIYKTSRNFLSERSAVIATMLSSLSYFYMVYFSIEYNQNSIMLLLWTMSAYYFWQAFQRQKLCDWLIFAVVAALAMLAKYESALILFLEGLYLLINFRHISNKKNLVIAFAVFIVLLIPHVAWLIKEDFLPIKYFSSRTTYLVPNDFLHWHIYQPLKVVAASLLNMLLPLLIFFICFKRKKFNRHHTKQLLHYLVFLGWAPVCLVFVIAAFFGMDILAEWGFPFFAFTISGLFCFFSIKGERLDFKKLTLVVIFIHCLNVIIYTSVVVFGKKIHTINYPAYSLAKEAESFWAAHEKELPIKYVGGVDRLSYYLAVYLSSKPALLQSFSFHQSPWIHPKQLKESGIIFILPGCRQSLPKQWATLVKEKKCFHTFAANKFKKIPFAFTLLIIPPHSNVPYNT
jgi:4-amino-4-deoxy-L-arabinose transferase-like glycosyltransferase